MGICFCQCGRDLRLAPGLTADLVDEVILQFTSQPGVKVKIAIEIQAEATTGFDNSLQRAVVQECGT